MRVDPEVVVRYDNGIAWNCNSEAPKALVQAWQTACLDPSATAVADAAATDAAAVAALANASGRCLATSRHLHMHMFLPKVHKLCTSKPANCNTS